MGAGKRKARLERAERFWKNWT